MILEHLSLSLRLFCFSILPSAIQRYLPTSVSSQDIISVLKLENGSQENNSTVLMFLLEKLVVVWSQLVKEHLQDTQI